VVSEISVPESSRLNMRIGVDHYRDAFSFTVNQENLSAVQVYQAIFGYLPKPVQLLLKVRNVLVKPFGFAASDTKMALELNDIRVGAKAGFLSVEAAEEHELICAAYDKNMDMWLSVMRVGERDFVLSTLVNLKTPLGRAYMAVIKPFHKRVAVYSVRKALASGRI